MILSQPLTWWLIDAAVAVLAGLIFAVIHWDFDQMRRWQPERIAYMQRLQERERRRPFDQAWAEWVAEVELRVMVDLIVDDFQRRVDGLADRSARSWAEFVAAADDVRPSLEVVR